VLAPSLVALAAWWAGAALLPPLPPSHAPIPPLDIGDPAAAVARFRAFLRFETVADPSAPDHVGARRDEFAAAAEFLRGTYGDAHGALSLDVVGGHTLVYTWQGRDPSLEPVLFISHYDVVPAAEGDGWSRPPFAAEVDEGGNIVARGAVDVKSGVVGLLEAATALLRGGHRPLRTVVFAFGHDEEVGGAAGARLVAERFRKRGTTFAVVVDEGGVVLTDGLGGGRLAAGPVALVGTSEKGYVTLRAKVRVPEPGHSSMPRTDGRSASDVAARLASKVSASPPAGVLASPSTDMLRRAAHRAPPLLRPLLASAGAFPTNRVVTALLRASGAAPAALTRTTAAVTRLAMGVADNVVPATAEVTVNFRLLPGTDVAFPERYMSDLLGDDRGFVTIDRDPDAWEAAPVTDPDGLPFQLLAQAIQETLGVGGGAGPVAVPYLLVGMTDSRHYHDLSRRGTLRFTPHFADQSAGDLQRIHGLDERMDAGDFLRGIQFYARAITLLADARHL